MALVWNGLSAFSTVVALFGGSLAAASLAFCPGDEVRAPLLAREAG